MEVWMSAPNHDESRPPYTGLFGSPEAYELFVDLVQQVVRLEAELNEVKAQLRQASTALRNGDDDE
jgi:hypothetical protein